MEYKARATLIPGELVELMRPVISEKKIDFDHFVLEAIRNYIQVIKYRDGIVGSFGAWEDSVHPELKEGVECYVREMRKGRTF